MKKSLEKIELFVDRAIPYLLIVLLGIVVIDIFFKDIAEQYHIPLLIADYTIISFFVVDLAFKYNRVRNIPTFIRKYWLDIIAVFPFFLILRLFEEILLLSEQSVSAVSNLFHIGVNVEEEILVGEKATKAAKASELLAKEGRVAMLSERLAFLRRIPRLIGGLGFYEHPNKKKLSFHKK